MMRADDGALEPTKTSQSESFTLKAYIRKALITNPEVENSRGIIIKQQKIWIHVMGSLILIWVYLHQNNSDTLKL